MYQRSTGFNTSAILRGRADAFANVHGSAEFARINGSVKFYQTARGVLTVAEIFGLPVSEEKCSGGIFAFHIHNGASCSGDQEDPFSEAGSHYDTDNCPHPSHAGDMPPLFGAKGTAFLAFLSDRFTISDIIGKTVIIHDKADDFTTQPSGNSGNKIACGEIIENIHRPMPI